MEILEPGFYYHIYNHANGRENLFCSDENYRFFISRYKKHIAPIADIFAYCLMPNHIHFLVRVKEEYFFIRIFSKVSNVGKGKKELFY